MEIWDSHPKSIRLIYGWLSAYQDVFDWVCKRYFFDYDGAIFIYPSFTKNACCKEDKIFFGIERDYNHNLDIGIVIHEIVHCVRHMSEQATEDETIEIVNAINRHFKIGLSHGDPSKIINVKNPTT